MVWLGQESVLMTALTHTIAVDMHVVECREDAEVVVGGRAASEHTLGVSHERTVRFPQANHGNIGPNYVTTHDMRYHNGFLGLCLTNLVSAVLVDLGRLD